MVFDIAANFDSSCASCAWLNAIAEHAKTATARRFLGRIIVCPSGQKFTQEYRRCSEAAALKPDKIY
jgi:hypothetical protein